ncbi:Stp1/IreP family PP2C-type Ser/Thr phosphatase [Candidatus Venteria ishoeyi]|uniref:Serine/threonine phosphatase stp n=1 Tax=Candidatus Venteria ishoeyi TaxID=1899563 RepID=A0A1H6FBB6_9GAMM|nr:Stp1/IreP family PP2C-type Ser/Thr phosphatase [Candidatus Venteria ishoeyi]MDM8545153.1 Stp1/IreP family PP2C-type Ser/Thr phosphatase [Candidatus Venteria ishoeyi]SEH06671.1 Serine/threonine phosphatase stp [Candidatus Venteria ishoeyi]
MSKTNTIQIVCHTDTGQLREHNEDRIVADVGPDCAIAVLADGMGGYQAGEIASEVAVTETMQALQAEQAQVNLVAVDESLGYQHASLLLQQAVLKANLAIFQTAQSRTEYRGMGTTIVAALFYAQALSIAHVGDSRLYRLRGQKLECLTNDHSVLQELIDNGLYTQEEARHSPNRNLVTRALGVNMDVEVELTEAQTQAGDRYLLCSDGLNDMLEDIKIQQILCAQTDLDQAAKQLLEAANNSGGEDNISVILVQIPPSSSQLPRQSWWQHLLAFFHIKHLG